MTPAGLPGDAFMIAGLFLALMLGDLAEGNIGLAAVSGVAGLLYLMTAIHRVWLAQAVHAEDEP